MSTQTKIEWCDSTFNPWIGCTKVSPACDNCYAEADFDLRRHRVKWGAGQERSRTSSENWNLPKRWNANACRFIQCDECGWRGEGIGSTCGRCHSTNTAPARRRVFCASLADVFDNEVPTSWRAELFQLIANTPNLDWLLLTKRIGNARSMLNEVVGELTHGINTWDELPWPNVWLGATVCNQAEADRDIPKLLAVPAAKRFLSMEPLLGPVELNGHEYTIALGLGEGVDWLTGITMEHSSIFGGSTWPWLYRADFDFPKDAREPRIHWVIVGGESGQNARPMHPKWVRRIRDQCAAAGVPFMFKQWGEWAPVNGLEYSGSRRDLYVCDWGEMARVGKIFAGRLLDGVEHNGFPESAVTP